MRTGSNVSPAELGWILFLGGCLFASALCLVELHCQTRQLFVAHEHEADVHRKLLDDQAELEMKVRRAALASNIGAGAAMLDLYGATGGETVTLVEAPDGSVDFLPEMRRQLEDYRRRQDAAAQEAKAAGDGKAAPGGEP